LLRAAQFVQRELLAPFYSENVGSPPAPAVLSDEHRAVKLLLSMLLVRLE
jgi:hypothetical protein